MAGYGHQARCRVVVWRAVVLLEDGGCAGTCGLWPGLGRRLVGVCQWLGKGGPELASGQMELVTWVCMVRSSCISHRSGLEVRGLGSRCTE